MACTMTPEECAAMRARIDGLIENYEDLLAGRKARVLVDQNGERIEFNGGDSRRLWNYIQSLEVKFSECCGLGGRKISRPIRPFF